MKLLEIATRQVTSQGLYGDKHKTALRLDSIIAYDRDNAEDVSGYKHFSNNPRHKVSRLGAGAEAVVYAKHTSSSTPIAIKMLHHYNTEDDQCPNLLYLTQINDSNNPFGPKVSKIKKITSPTQQGCMFVITMERLYPIDYKDAALGAKLLQSIIVDPKSTASIINYKRIHEGIFSCIRSGSHNIVVDQQTYKLNDRFVQAIDIIRSVARNNDSFNYDSGMDNIMMRHGSNGSELVIVDPLYVML